MGSLQALLNILPAQQFGRRMLRRQCEPSAITDQVANVVQYDQVMTTGLAVGYAGGLMVVHRVAAPQKGASAVDLASGPGHYTLCLAQHLQFSQVVGIDLSPPMVEVATRNAADKDMQERVRFRAGDITRLGEIESNQFGLSTFNNAAHHMPDLETVARVLREMDRVTRGDGLVMLMDLVRLRTKEVTERYVNTLGRDYVDRGLPAFLEDFRNSMYAAWTDAELREAIPRDTDRYWCHIVPRGLPTIQIVVGLPVGRRRLFVRSGFPWEPAECPVPTHMKTEWRLLRMSLKFASRHWISPMKR